MGEAKDAQDFDWVAARHTCSPFSVYKTLEEQVKSDIARRNKQQHDVNFRVDTSADRFIVFREASRLSACPSASVQFRWNQAGIDVWNDSEVFLEGALTVNDEAECRIKVKGVELTFWQFRRRALEDLLFNYKPLSETFVGTQFPPA
jgi:hypothetical protein